MIIAREKGRSLELIVGGGEDALVFIVPPIPARVGAEILADWIGIAIGATDGDAAAAAALNTAKTAIGDAIYDDPAFQDLRWSEQDVIINAAFMWNVQGGGIELVNTYLDGGLPKAREELLARTGVTEALQGFTQLLASELGLPTSTDDSPATSTPPGGETPAEPSR